MAERVEQVAFDALDQVVAAFHGPISRHQHVDGDERAPPGAPASQGVEAHRPLGREACEYLVHERQLVDRQSAVHHPARRPPHERDAGEHDVGGHGERDQRIEHVPAADRHRHHADHDADRGTDIGHQVPPVGLQRQRPVLAAGCDQQSRHGQVDPRGEHGHGHADADVGQRLGVQEAVDRRDTAAVGPQSRGPPRRRSDASSAGTAQSWCNAACLHRRRRQLAIPLIKPRIQPNA